MAGAPVARLAGQQDASVLGRFRWFYNRFVAGGVFLVVRAGAPGFVSYVSKFEF